MTAPRDPSTIFKNVLIVSASEGHAKIDREFLKSARILLPRTVTSADAALAVLRRKGADLVICDGPLEDTDGFTLVKTMRADPTLASIPVIMATTDNAKAAVLTAVQLGCAGYLIRPYSQAAFARHLTMAAHMAVFAATEKAVLARAKAKAAAGDTDAAIAAFAAVAEAPDAAPRAFEAGMVALARSDYDAAIAAFHKAVEINKLFVEAYLGLARSWQAKGVVRNYRRFMKEAASACARARRFVELKDAFIELLATDETRFNPFLALGNELLRDRHYAASVTLFRQALELAPKNGDVFVSLGKAYHFLGRRDLALKAVTKGLSLEERNLEGQILYKRYAGRAFGDIPPLEATRPEDGAPRFPWLLRGMLYLAGLATDGLWRARRRVTGLAA